MGAQPGVEDARGRLAYSHNGGRFMVTKPVAQHLGVVDGKPQNRAAAQRESAFVALGLFL